MSKKDKNLHVVTQPLLIHNDVTPHQQKLMSQFESPNTQTHGAWMYKRKVNSIAHSNGTKTLDLKLSMLFSRSKTYISILIFNVYCIYNIHRPHICILCIYNTYGIHRPCVYASIIIFSKDINSRLVNLCKHIIFP